MSLSATLFGRDSAIFKATNILGLGIPGWLDKKFGVKDSEVEGPRLSDLSVQTSTYGAPITRLYGTIAVMGNVIWLENNKLKETVRKKKSNSGGKGGGGGSSEPTTTYSYSATFHLALCEGPIAGVRRIWCGDRLIYNAGSGELETVIASNKAARGWKLYLGTESQLPDSRYEADVGVGNASAHRGTAYIAFYDFQLASYSNTLQAAQFKVEVVTSLSDPETNISTESIVFTQPHENSAFSPHPYYVSAQEVDFFVPNWNNDLPATSTLGSYSFTLSGNNKKPDIEITGGTGVPPSGYSDDKGDYFKEKPDELADALGMTGLSGHFVKRNGKYAAIAGSPASALVLYYAVAGNPSALTISTPVPNAYAVALSDSDEIFVVYQDKVEVYSLDLSLAETLSVNPPNDVVGEPRARHVDGKLYVWNGRNNIWELDLDTLSAISYTMPQSVGFSGYSGEFSVENGVVTRAYYTYGPPKRLLVNRVALSVVQINQIPLANIIENEVQLSNLIESADIDVAELTATVRGYRVSGGSIRSALEPLQAAFPFDLRQHGYKIQFIPRGQESVSDIPFDDLGATNGSAPDEIFQQSREMDSQKPARTAIKYLDAAREYAISEQYSERLNTEAVNKVDREIPLVLTADEAAGVAEALNFLPWLERTSTRFTLPPIYRYLEPGDVVRVSVEQATYELRLTETNELPDGRLECEALPNRAALYTSSAVGSDGVPPSGTIGLSGASVFVPLDIPVVDETVQNAVGFVGAMTGDTSGWPGALLVRSNDGGQTWVDIQAYTGKASIGTALTTLPGSDCTLIDQRNLNVSMISGTPEGITRDQMLAGANYAAYGVDGRWEIVRFQNASLQDNETYTVSGFVRGDRGTEWATGLHEAGDYFVLLDDPDNAFIGSPVETISLERTYRGVTAGDGVDDAADVAFTYRGVNLECLSPVYANGTRDGSSNFTGMFTRRSRLSSSWWTTGVVAPVGETTESYEIDVMDGSDVVRTISVTSPTFSYSAADQTTDFGSAQSSIDFRIYQLSEIVGRGYPLEITL